MEEIQFFDALDEFSFPDHDLETVEIPDFSQRLRLGSLENEFAEVSGVQDPPENSFSDSFTGTLRRRASNQLNKGAVSDINGLEEKLHKDWSSYSSLVAESSRVFEETAGEKRNKLLKCLEDHEKLSERLVSSEFRLSSNCKRSKDAQIDCIINPNHDFSSFSSLNKDLIGEESEIDSSTSKRLEDCVLDSNSNDEGSWIPENRVETSETFSKGFTSAPFNDFDGSPSNFLALIAELVIRAIGLQVGLLISFITFPIWLLHLFYKLVTEPFHTVKWATEHAFESLLKIYASSREKLTRVIQEHFPDLQSFGKLAKRFGWGCFWSFYVCFVLFVFLGSAFIIGGFTMGKFVEEPIRMTETLNFDYTMDNPAAVVPITSCEGFACVDDRIENFKAQKTAGRRLIPPNHKFQLKVSLTLPESDYNRKVGVFQVKVEFQSANGEVIARSSHPCMLRFKSLPLRFAETFLRSGPLLAGYSTESQILNLRMTGFIEGAEPTACIRVILEHRAEYKPGTGIPEIYAASFLLESELPVVKRFIWCWKRTIFIWASMGFFIMELLLILACCRPVIFPSARPVDGSPNRS